MTRCARAVVSSMWLERLTTNGTLPSASANAARPGSVKAGFASFTMSTAISPWAIAFVRARTSAYRLARESAELGPKRTVRPTFPSA